MNAEVSGDFCQSSVQANIQKKLLALGSTLTPEKERKKKGGKRRGKGWRMEENGEEEKYGLELNMVVNITNPSKKAGAEGSQVQGQSEPRSETPPQNKPKHTQQHQKSLEWVA